MIKRGPEPPDANAPVALAPDDRPARNCGQADKGDPEGPISPRIDPVRTPPVTIPLLLPPLPPLLLTILPPPPSSLSGAGLPPAVVRALLPDPRKYTIDLGLCRKRALTVLRSPLGAPFGHPPDALSWATEFRAPPQVARVSRQTAKSGSRTAKSILERKTKF